MCSNTDNVVTINNIMMSVVSMQLMSDSVVCIVEINSKDV